MDSLIIWSLLQFSLFFSLCYCALGEELGWTCHVVSLIVASFAGREELGLDWTCHVVTLIVASFADREELGPRKLISFQVKVTSREETSIHVMLLFSLPWLLLE